MSLILTVISAVSFALNGICTRLFQKLFVSHKTFINLYQCLFCGVSAFAFFAVSSFSPVINTPLALSGISFGVLFFATMYGAAVGYESGSMALTAVIVNMSMLVPVLYSCLFEGEALTPLRIVGIVLTVIVFILSSSDGKDGKENPKILLWITAVAVAFFSNGITLTVQKVYVTDCGDDTLMQFMSLAYLTASLCFLICFLARSKGGRPDSDSQYTVKSLISLAVISTVSGLGSWGGNALLGIACASVPSSVLYPCLHGILCTVVVLTSILFFGEKASKRKTAAILTGIAAVMILNI